MVGVRLLDSLRISRIPPSEVYLDSLAVGQFVFSESSPCFSHSEAEI